jgi:hypothetical protein
MHVSDRNRLKKQQRALLLASSDMDQAAAAARMLLGEENDEARARALETAMATCYMRPFTTSDLKIPDAYIPTEDMGGFAHDHLKAQRDQVYAHTDERGGRKIQDFRIEIEGEIVQFKWLEGWVPFPRANLPFVIDLCERQAHRMRVDAALIQRELDGGLKPEDLHS